MTTADAAPPHPEPAAPADLPRRSLRLRRTGEVLVATPLGSLDAEALEGLRRRLLTETGPVIVRLDECIVVDPAAVARIAGAGDEVPRDVCLVASRPTCRLLLARSGIAARVAVFRQVEDALQARVLAQAGYGPGWVPA